jgi:hypothetical protein
LADAKRKPMLTIPFTGPRFSTAWPWTRTIVFRGCAPPQPFLAKIIQLNQSLLKTGQEPAFFGRPRIKDLACRFKSPCNQPASRSNGQTGRDIDPIEAT